DSYAEAKGLLFRWPGLKAAVINADDPAGARYRALLADGVACLRYSLDAGSDAELVAETVEPSLDGLVLTLRTPQGPATLRSPLL
ncbi:Mur ligase family protein, partial [Acinetobacter baumannii]